MKRCGWFAGFRHSGVCGTALRTIVLRSVPTLCDFTDPLRQRMQIDQDAGAIRMPEAPIPSSM
jgi:hypothetical protein